MSEPRCPICATPPNPWCLEDHVAEARDQIALNQAAVDRLRNETDAYEKVCLERTGQAEYIKP